MMDGDLLFPSRGHLGTAVHRCASRGKHKRDGRLGPRLRYRLDISGREVAETCFPLATGDPLQRPGLRWLRRSPTPALTRKHARSEDHRADPVSSPSDPWQVH
jgi:hypothetical protein